MKSFSSRSAITVLVCILILSSCFDDTPSIRNNAGSARQAVEGYDIKWISNAVDVSLGTEPEVREGILHFKDEQTFRAAIEKLKNLSEKEKLAFAKIKNFKSLFSIYSEIDSSVALATKAKDVNKFKNILSTNKRFVKIDQDNSLKHIFADDIITSLLNEDGLVYVGKMLFYFTPNKQQIIFDGDKNKINTTSDAVQTFQPMDYPIGPGVDPTSCPNGISKTITSSFGWDRDRLDVHVNTYVTTQTNGLYSFNAYVYAKGWEETWHPFPFFFWQTVPVNNARLYCKWQMVVYQGIPLVNLTEAQDILIIENDTYIGRSGSTMSAQNMTAPNNLTYNLILPGTGYYQGTVAIVPMSCQ